MEAKLRWTLAFLSISLFMNALFIFNIYEKTFSETVHVYHKHIRQKLYDKVVKKVIAPFIKASPTRPPQLQWLDISEGKNYSDYGDGTCGESRHRSSLIPLFKRWIQIAKKHNLTYCLICGTLLGAWRNAELIPYDSDIDLWVDGDQINKIEAISDKRNFSGDKNFHFVIQEDWRKPYGKRLRKTCKGRYSKSMVDECSFQDPLVRLFQGHHHIELYEVYRKNGTVVDPLYGPAIHSEKDVFPFKKCMFMGIETICPHNPKPILHRFYGKNLHPSRKCKNKKWH